MRKLDRILAGWVVLALVTVCGTAQAEFGLDRGGSTRGYWISESGGIGYEVAGSGALQPDGSVIDRLGCFGSGPGEIGCSVSGIPWPLDDWWDRPALPTWAATQAYADFGTLRARSIVVVDPAGDTGQSLPSPGHREYSATAISAWREDLYNTGSEPTFVVFDFTLEASWNDFGRFALTMGREYYGNDQFEVDGVVYKNCELGSNECDVAPGEGTLIHVPGDDPDNESGSVNQTVSFTYLLYPSAPDDDGGLDPVTFLVQLETFAFLLGAEVDAYQSVTLDRIRVEPGAQVGFGSGSAWNVVVPEPATWALWLMGLAGVATGRLRARR